MTKISSAFRRNHCAQKMIEPRNKLMHLPYQKAMRTHVRLLGNEHHLHPFSELVAGSSSDTQTDPSPALSWGLQWPFNVQEATKLPYKDAILTTFSWK